MDDERLAELLEKLEAATLTPVEAEELRAAVEATPALKERAGRHVALGRMLRASQRPAPDVQAFLAKLPPAPKVTPVGAARAPRRRWWPIAATVAMAAAAGFVVGIAARRPAQTSDVAVTRSPAQTTDRPTSTAATIARIQGRARDIGADQDLQPGDGLAPGTWLASDAGSAVRLTLPAATADLRAHTVVGVLPPEAQDTHLYVANGALTVIARPAARLAVDTPHARVRLHGATGTVLVRDRETHVALTAGTAQVRDTATGRTRELEGVQSAVVSAGEDASAPSSRNVLFVVGLRDGALEPADAAIRDRLASLGHEVEIADGSLAPPPLDQRTLLVLSSTIEARGFSWDLRNTPVPMLSWESMLYVRLGWVADDQKNLGRAKRVDSVVINDPSHPLAAGLQGTVRVSARRGDMAWGYPSPWAAFIAHSPKEPTEFLIFGYEKGAKLPYGTAAARRVGFFPLEELPLSFTDEGWRLFDAAVKWATAPAP